jgi:GDP-L-fucose synthase
VEGNRLGKIFVAGSGGLVGSHLVKVLEKKNYKNLLLPTRQDLDLLDSAAVSSFFAHEKPDTVIVAAAKVGGIYANNTYRADFIYENLKIQNNLIWGAHQHQVENLVFLGSSCIYPRLAPQPMPEDCLLSGPLEYTNRPYALAKIAGLELVNSLRMQYGCRYFSVMPTNLYGPGDNFKENDSHVIPALIRRFFNACERNADSLSVWGTGAALREFMHAEDCAEAIVFLLETPHQRFEELLGTNTWSHINVGSGDEISIRDLVATLAKIFAFKGTISFDASKPDGTPRKLLDTSLLRTFGWQPQVPIAEGLSATVAWFVESMKSDHLRIRS